MGDEGNGAVLHNWKVKSLVAGMTQTFLHPPSVLILNFICFFSGTSTYSTSQKLKETGLLHNSPPYINKYNPFTEKLSE